MPDTEPCTGRDTTTAAAAAVLTRLRERQGPELTQGELGWIAGLPRPYISRLERGEEALSPDVLTKLAPVYGVSLGALLYALAVEGGLPPPPPRLPAPLEVAQQALAAGPGTAAERDALLRVLWWLEAPPPSRPI